MDTAELRLFETSLRSAVDRHSGEALDAALDDLGWREALREDRRAIASMFAAQGDRAVASSALDDVICVGLGAPADRDLSVVLPALGRYDAPATLDGQHLVVDGIGTGRARRPGHMLIAVDGSATSFVVRAPVSHLAVQPVAGIDPDGEWVTVTGRIDVGTADRVDADWTAGVALGQLGVAQELAAGSRAMLRLARDHAVERTQSGRPLSGFQAVRHRLADGLLAVESADAAIAAGWDEPSAYRAAMAKAIAGRSTRTVARHAQQVLGGMGFTAEHGFHRLMKRAMALDQVLGASATLSAEIGRQAIEQRHVPPMLAL
jgi:hypothetical protein